MPQRFHAALTAGGRSETRRLSEQKAERGDKQRGGKEIHESIKGVFNPSGGAVRRSYRWDVCPPRKLNQAATAEDGGPVGRRGRWGREGARRLRVLLASAVGGKLGLVSLECALNCSLLWASRLRSSRIHFAPRRRRAGFGGQARHSYLSNLWKKKRLFTERRRRKWDERRRCNPLTEAR